MALTAEDVLYVEEIISKKLDEREKIITIGRSDLNELKDAVKNLIISQDQLTIAQFQSEKRLDSLTVKMEELTDAQIKTERRLGELGSHIKGIGKSIGYMLENEAYRFLPQILNTKYGIEVKEKILRKGIEYSDGEEDEINIICKGKKNGEEIYVIGESRSRLDKRDIKDIINTAEKLKQLPEFKANKQFLLVVTHYAAPSVLRYAELKNIAVVQSYEF